MAINFKKIKLVIFDFDDTLVNNYKLDFHSFADVLDRPIKKSDLLRLRKQGLLSRQIMQRFIDQKETSLEAKIKQRTKLLESGKLHKKYVRVFPGVKGLLKQIINKDIKLAIVSVRKEKQLIKKLLNKAKVENSVKYIYCGDDFFKTNKEHNNYKLKLKGYKEAMKFFLISAHQVLVVGDDIDDLKAAEALGIGWIRIKNSYKETLFTNTKYKSPAINRVGQLTRYL